MKKKFDKDQLVKIIRRRRTKPKHLRVRKKLGPKSDMKGARHWLHSIPKGCSPLLHSLMKDQSSGHLGH